MTSQGTPHGRFQRAIRDRHLRRATMAARELGNVSLADALALTLLTAETRDDRSPRAAARWLGRFIVESPAITIGEAALAAAAIQEFSGSQLPIDCRDPAATRRDARTHDGRGTPGIPTVSADHNVLGALGRPDGLDCAEDRPQGRAVPPGRKALENAHGKLDAVAPAAPLPQPMLARSGQMPARGDWAYEVKWTASGGSSVST